MPVDVESNTSLKIAYLGPEASFSHQAAIEVFTSQSLHPTPTLHPLPTFSAIFSSIQNPSPPPGGASYDYAVVPIENSTNGSVVQVLDLLAQCGLDSSALYPNVEVCAEYYLPVHHCLFIASNSNAAANSTDLSAHPIRTIYTHPQVWGQCGRFLSTHFAPNAAERIDVGSTSAAAQLVASESNGGESAAISSKLAGQRHNLTCLAENIEDEPGSNTTRFFVIRNRRCHPPQVRELNGGESSPVLGGSQSALEANPGARYKSLITFTIPHTTPGALADTLAVFKQYSFNLTSIDTRPSRKRNWQYVFFVECEEALSTTSPANQNEDKSLKMMLQDLGKFTESLRYLGRFIDQLQTDNGEK